MEEPEERYWPGSTALVKENDAYVLYQDAVTLLELAGAHPEESETTGVLARSAAALLLLAFDAYANSVYTYLQVPETVWERWSTKTKWLNAPQVCLDGYFHDPVEVGVFDETVEPFLSFAELLKVRNSIAHLRSTIHHMVVEDVPGFTYPDEVWPVTGIPKHFLRWQPSNARRVLATYEAMTSRLDELLHHETHMLRGGALMIERVLADEADDPSSSND